MWPFLHLVIWMRFSDQVILRESFDQCYVHKVEEIYSLGEVKIWDWAPVKESAYAVGETVMELEVEMEEELMTS